MRWKYLIGELYRTFGFFLNVSCTHFGAQSQLGPPAFFISISQRAVALPMPRNFTGLEVLSNGVQPTAVGEHWDCLYSPSLGSKSNIDRIGWSEGRQKTCPYHLTSLWATWIEAVFFCPHSSVDILDMLSQWFFTILLIALLSHPS